MKNKETQLWIPLYVDKWIFGSTRIELEPGERSVFTDLLVLGAKDCGFIRANETTPYHHSQIAGLLNIPVELLKTTIAKCLHFNKLQEPTPGIYRLTNWDTYTLSTDYKYRLETGRRVIPGTPVRENSDTCPENIEKSGPIRKERIGKDKKEEKSTEPVKQDVKPKQTAPVIPEWMKPLLPLFEDFIAMRKAKKNPMTVRAQELAISHLAALSKDGNDPQQVLEQSIMRGWQGLFAIKVEERKPSTYKHPEQIEREGKIAILEAEFRAKGGTDDDKLAAKVKYDEFIRARLGTKK